MPDINALFPSKYLKAADLEQPRVLTMRGVRVEEIDDGEHKPVLYFREEKLGLVLNKTNAMLIGHCYGNATEGWNAQPLELYKDVVLFQGRTVDCIRVRQPQQAAPAPAAQPPGPPPLADDDIPFS